jgi:hypothetical protein
LLEAIATVEGLDTSQLPNTASAPETPAVSATPTPLPGVAAVLELLSVTVEPAEVKAGDVVRLVLQFQLGGMGVQTPITEERQIYRDDVALLATPRSSTEVFGEGLQRTQLEFRVPPEAPAGAYVFEGVVRGAGVEKRRRAVFLVRE